MSKTNTHTCSICGEFETQDRDEFQAHRSREVLDLIEANGGPEGLDLSGRNLLFIDLGPDVIKAQLRQTYKRDPNSQLPPWWKESKTGINLIGANLQQAWLLEANLEEANLMGADLQNAYLQDANLQGATASFPSPSSASPGQPLWAWWLLSCFELIHWPGLVSTSPPSRRLSVQYCPPRTHRLYSLHSPQRSIGTGPQPS